MKVFIRIIKYKEKIVRMVIPTNNRLNVNLKNVLYADMKIISLPNAQNHLNMTINDKIKSISVNGVIVHSKNDNYKKMYASMA